MKKSKFEIETPFDVVIASLVLLAVTAGLILLFTLISSLLLMSTEDPLAHIGTFSFIILFLSVFTASFVFGKLVKSPPICGLISGLLVSAILLFCSAIVNVSGDTSPLWITVTYIAVPVVSYLGALLALRSNDKKRKPSFKRRKTHK